MRVKKVFKFTFYVLLTFVGLVFLYLGSAYCLSRIQVDQEANAKDEVEIFIKTNSVHTDIVFPVENSQINWSKEQYSRLIKYVSDSFQKDKDGHFVKIKTNAIYGNMDASYFL